MWADSTWTFAGFAAKINACDDLLLRDPGRGKALLMEDGYVRS
jgi:hypothetical protein